MMINKSKPEPMKKLFSSPAHHFSLPDLEHNSLDDAYDEIELIGFPVSLTWFDMLKTPFRGEVTARNLIRHTGEKSGWSDTLLPSNILKR